MFNSMGEEGPVFISKTLTRLHSIPSQVIPYLCQHTINPSLSGGTDVLSTTVFDSYRRTEKPHEYDTADWEGFLTFHILSSDEYLTAGRSLTPHRWMSQEDELHARKTQFSSTSQHWALLPDRMETRESAGKGVLRSLKTTAV